MRVEVDSYRYTNEYGHRPRGFGSWAFGPSWNSKPEEIIWVHMSKYGDAKQKAQAIAAERNLPMIVVLP